MADSKNNKEKDNSITYLKNVYIENIPMEALRDPYLPKRYRYLLGFIAYVVMGFLFLYSLVNNYQTALKERYMSFQSDSGNCETVSKPLSGTFKMDYYGNWEGSAHFQHNQALYEIEFNRLLVDDTTFRGIMADINLFVIQPFVQYATWLPLYYILLYHMGHERSIEINGNRHSFRFNGYPRRVYDAETFFGGIATSTVQGCNFQGASSTYIDAGFDYQSATLYLHYDYQSYVNTPQCMGALNTSTIIVPQFSSPREIKFEVDVESLIVADAVNKMLIPFENMIQATAERYDFGWKDGYNYTYTSWYYPRYPDMDPIWCILGVDYEGNMLDDSSVYDPMDPRWSGRVLPPFFCFIKWTDVMMTDGTYTSHYFFPLFQHMYPGCQSCPSRPTYTKYLEAPAEICNNLFFYTSLVYFPYSSNTSGLDMISYWFMKNQSGASYWASWLGMESNGASWGATFGGNFSGFDSLNHDERDFPYGTNYSDMFAFCGGDCSIISIGSINNEFTISKDFYALREGACRDSMSTPHWEKFSSPPQPLVEPYFSCTQTTWDAFNDALGIASGFAASLGSLALLLLLPCVYIYKEDKKGPTKEELISKFGDLLVETEKTRRTTKNGLDVNDMLKLLNELTEPQEEDEIDYRNVVHYEGERDRGKLYTSMVVAEDQLSHSSIPCDIEAVRTDNCDKIKNVAEGASLSINSSFIDTNVIDRSRRLSTDDFDSPSSTGFNRPRENVDSISSKIKRVSMSGGKIQLQEKDSDDEEENTAILKTKREDVNQYDHGLSHQIKFTENKHNTAAIDTNDNTSDGDAVDESGNDGIHLHIGEEGGYESAAVPTISSEWDGDVDLNNYSIEEEHGVSRSTSDYLQMY